MEFTMAGPPGTESLTFTVDAEKARASGVPRFVAGEIEAGRWNIAAAALAEVVTGWSLVYGDLSKPAGISAISIEGMGRTTMRDMSEAISQALG